MTQSQLMCTWRSKRNSLARVRWPIFHPLSPVNFISSNSMVRIVHHPSSHMPDDIIPLHKYLDSKCRMEAAINSGANWYHPFDSMADFVAADHFMKHGFSNIDIDEFILNQRTIWSQGSHISFNSHRDVRKLVNRVAKKTVRVSHIYPSNQ